MDDIDKETELYKNDDKRAKVDYNVANTVMRWGVIIGRLFVGLMVGMVAGTISGTIIAYRILRQQLQDGGTPDIQIEAAKPEEEKPVPEQTPQAETSPLIERGQAELERTEDDKRRTILSVDLLPNKRVAIWHSDHNKKTNKTKRNAITIGLEHLRDIVQAIEATAKKEG